MLTLAAVGGFFIPILFGRNPAAAAVSAPSGPVAAGRVGELAGPQPAGAAATPTEGETI